MLRLRRGPRPGRYLVVSEVRDARTRTAGISRAELSTCDMSPVIVGIDPSLTSTGICHPDGTTSLIVPGKLVGCDRLVFIRDWIRPLIDDVDVLVIEAVPTQGAMSIAPLAGLGAVIRVAAHEALIPFVDVSPSTRAKFACGDQKSRDKDAVLARAIRAGSPANTNDEADAWWLWQIGTAAYDPTAVLHAYQHEALQAITWPSIHGHQPSTVNPNPKKKSKGTNP